jgi:maltooligosyltrehalose trehalohydrolase
MVLPPEQAGWGLDAVWADDFHHQMRRARTGDRDGYFADYSGSTADIAATIRRGWFFSGQFSPHLRAPRGTDPARVPPRRCIVCLQNHDQVGNRALGDRLNHGLDDAAYRAASALLLLLPETPLLFMGQEWAASSPFRFFTDHHAALGKLVTEGRRREFRGFASFAGAGAASIPDPQAEQTFTASQLHWDERGVEPHAGMLCLYRSLLELRRQTRHDARREDATTAQALNDDTVMIRRSTTGSSTLTVVARLRGTGRVPIPAPQSDGATGWSVVLTTEDDEFAVRASAPVIDLSAQAPVIEFHGPATVVLLCAPPDAS